MPFGIAPHDLLRIRSGKSLLSENGIGWPSWVDAELVSPVWVVARRAFAPPGQVAVGIRGAVRSHRWPAFVRVEDVAQCISPHAVSRGPTRDLAVFSALTALGPMADKYWPSAWGPAGSVGFELVTGRHTATATSDLDLVVIADRALDRDVVGRQMAELRRAAAPVRLDVQIQTPYGAVAVDDWLSRAEGGVALRTVIGPRLVRDPWSGR